jgi:hypothetical protein
MQIANSAGRGQVAGGVSVTGKNNAAECYEKLPSDRESCTREMGENSAVKKSDHVDEVVHTELPLPVSCRTHGARSKLGQFRILTLRNERRGGHPECQRLAHPRTNHRITTRGYFLPLSTTLNLGFF